MPLFFDARVVFIVERNLFLMRYGKLLKIIHSLLVLKSRSSCVLFYFPLVEDFETSRKTIVIRFPTAHLPIF